MLLIPAYGLEGAALTATLAYGANTLYQLIVFMRITHTPWTMLLPRQTDLDLVRRAWKAMLGGRDAASDIQ
jgi:Na+-driven multidrug efflux pump